MALSMAVVCGVALGIRVCRVDAMRQYLAMQHYEDVYYLPPTDWLPVFSLGYHEALADLIWLKALVYFGDELYHRGQVAYLFNYVDAMLALDPGFRQIYRWVGSAALYRTGTVTSKDAWRAISYLEKGVRRFPDDGELAWDLGASLSYELPPLLSTAAEKEKAIARGVPYLETAARLGAGPSWLALSNATQLVRLGQVEQALRHLEEIYATVHDPETREQIRYQIARYRDQAYAEAFEHAHKEFQSEWQRDYPYLPSTLFMLVGPKIPIDDGALAH
ncbi:MAG: hypothetical protein H6714_07560 [Myxococcales bacterium]|nr:hypothetical protein [Myxococcales bacterium]